MSCVRRVIDVPVSREEAWRSIVDPEWLGEPIGDVEELEEARRLSWRWERDGEESVVDVTLDDVENGTRITVVEVRTTELETALRPLIASSAQALALA